LDTDCAHDHLSRAGKQKAKKKLEELAEHLCQQGGLISDDNDKEEEEEED